MPNNELPEFKSPPLHEVVLSVSLEPMGLRIPHFGLFWQTLRRDYPLFDVREPIVPVDEPGVPQSQISLLLNSPDAVRCWFMDETKTRLVQIQNDRFVNNWRRVEGNEVYPRYYKDVRKRFETEWARLAKFVAQEELAGLKPIKCEMIYINHIPASGEWDEVSHLSEMMALWSGSTTTGFLPSPKHVTFSSRYAMPNESGSLIAAFTPVVEIREQRKAFQLRLQANGAPKAPNFESVLEWFDLAHEWIVQGFTDLTTTSMHQAWGLIQREK